MSPQTYLVDLCLLLQQCISPQVTMFKMIVGLQQACSERYRPIQKHF